MALDIKRTLDIFHEKTSLQHEVNLLNKMMKCITSSQIIIQLEYHSTLCFVLYYTTFGWLPLFFGYSKSSRGKCNIWCVVYKITCKFCGNVYVGNNQNTLKKLWNNTSKFYPRRSSTIRSRTLSLLTSLNI